MPVHPYPIFNGRLVDTLSGEDSPSPPTTHPLYPWPYGLCVWRHRPGGATRVLHGRFSIAQKKGDGHSSPCLKAGGILAGYLMKQTT
jgi:hypothetical protein